ncbi:MAG TPA: FAD-binding protein [Caulobacterales bacterium]|nr:FAD-binding protein [Caulobacterales bacterium]
MGANVKDAAPLVIKSAEELRWDDAADVVIIGYGGAGACAALEARAAGAEVLVIDRFGGGGTTAFSGGVIYAGATRFQREAGFDDTPAKMFAYLSLEVRDAVREETLHRYCDGSAADVEWLVSHGVQYASDAYLEKTIFPPEGKYLYYSGNEKAPAYAEKTPPIPRGHRAVGAGYGGQYYFAALARSAARNGVRIRTHENAQRLITDASGRVIGVEVRSLAPHLHETHQRLYERASPSLPHNNKSVEKLRAEAMRLEEQGSSVKRIRARNGVILATGGFAFSPEMLRRYSPAFARHYLLVHNLATLGNDGTGVALAEGLGAGVGRMESLYVARNVAPPEAALHGIMVNQQGRRFVNEDAYSSAVGLGIAQQPDCKAWLILPAGKFRAAVKQAMFCGWHRFKFFGAPALINFALGGTKRGANVQSIARACGIDASGLRESAAEHDRAIAENKPDPGGKDSHNRAALGDGPFYAINMSISNGFALTPFMTLGGLRVDEDTGAVLRADGGVIAGLYAAGVCAMGLHSNGYISGISLGDGVFSGRRAGRACAAVRRAAEAAHV